MILHECRLAGCYLLEYVNVEDGRGSFTRVFCADEFSRHGLTGCVSQCSVSFNERKGTLRGLHYQAPPYGEAKLIRCTRGRIFDVAVDLRPDSPTLGTWQAWEIDDSNQFAVYLPEGIAHGFLTLEPKSELTYHISASYQSEAARGVRWDDPTLAIGWPMAPVVVSDRDRALPRLDAR